MPLIMPTNYVTIPVIPYGLRQEETIIQIANALKSLETVTTDVFEQIENNINSHKRYLTELQKRSEAVASKVEKLSGKNVAATVFSHNKFPTKENNFDTLFNVKLKSIDDINASSVQTKHPHAKYTKSANKPHFYHVKSPVSHLRRGKYEELVGDRGLGGIPQDVDDVSSLLLFNTKENLYSNYVMLDPLGVDQETQPAAAEQNAPKADIAAAPNSIANNYLMQNNEYFNSFYTPAYHEVPSINVPVDLPDLPGIADFKFNTYPEKNVVTSKQSTQATDATDAKAAEEAVVRISIPTAVTGFPPPPPPLPEVVSAPPPPPPPPLPTAAAEIVQETESAAIAVSAEPPKPASAPAGDMHANLMEAIRNAGGKAKAKLRSVSAEMQDNEGKSKMSEPKEGSFMADLYAKLALRRKGISGQSKEGAKNVSMLDRMSSLIPPSPPNESDSNEDTSDGWDD